MKAVTMQLRHYGSNKFDRAKFAPIKDREFVKPHGGLWTSPVGSTEGWKEWCEAENFSLADLTKSFEVDFKGRVLAINTTADLDALEWKSAAPMLHYSWPRFEPLLAQGYDAIHLTGRGQWATRLSFPRSFYGWDCETVLVLNPASIS